ncbi:MAG TPA: RuBisCO large subunit C-terminal-like domain-containing protein [Xanthobacteraceae bacterium]
MHPRLSATYHIHSDARAIETRAQALAVEQSVEMPLAAIDDPFVRTEIVGRVEAIAPKENGKFEVRIALASETVGDDPGQLLNMLFGNSSLHDDVTLYDVELPSSLEQCFGGPRHGLHGLRRRAGASARALTCAPLKPQGLSPRRLADLARRYALGRIDFIKDDHGLADQAYAPFEVRVATIAEALRKIDSRSASARYVPSLSGDLETMRRQIATASAVGLDTVMVAPMIAGLSNFHRLVREHPQIAFVAHPGMAGAARIAPALLLGKLFRMLGADAVIFPNYGGRFGYTPDICRALAREAVARREHLEPCMPVPAGGMHAGRVAEMLDFYGAEAMLLIGGALLEAGARLIEATAAFVEQVHRHSYVADEG